MRNKICRTFLFIIATVVLILPLFLSSCSLDGNKEKYVAHGETAVLKEYSGGSQVFEYTIKDEFEGKPVTEILDFALSNNEYLEKIIIGPNVTTIGSWAFSNCKKLKAFEVSTDNAHFASLDGVLYTKDMKTLLAYPNNSHGTAFSESGGYSALGSFSVPYTVTEIRDNAFYRCPGLKSVLLPNGLKILGNRAFFRCEALEGIVLPDGLTAIGEDCFSQCSADTFKSLFVPKTVVNIGSYAFFNSSIKTLYFGASEAEFDAVTLGDNVIQREVTAFWGASR